MRGLAGVVLACLLVPWASAQQLRLSIADIDHPAFVARRLELRLVDGTADLDIAELRIAGRDLKQVRFSCGELRWTKAGFECAGGRLKLAGVEPLAMSFTVDRGRGEVELRLERAALASLVRVFPELAAWHPVGVVDGTLHLGATGLNGQLRLSGLGFADGAGDRAAEKLAVDIEVAAQRGRGDAWQWSAQLRWLEGEVYWQPIYLKAAAQRLTLRGGHDGGSLRIDAGEADLGVLGKLDFTLDWDRSSATLRSATLKADGIDLAAAVPTLVQPWLDTRALPKLEAAGSAALAIDYRQGAVQRFDVELAGASLAETDTGGVVSRFALGGVDAHIPWRRDAKTQVEFRAAGGRFGRLAIGAFQLPVQMEGFHFILDKAEIPLLDSRIVLENVRARREGDEWRWRVSGALEPMSMVLLTDRLGLPSMKGALSAAIPKIAYRNQTLSLDGSLVISVFDGYVSATGLKVVDPLGRSPRLEAELEMRHFDLGMLTETFKFGRITGYIDGDVKNLELVNWQPQTFDARIYSSPGDYRKRISQSAVQDISSLGGAGAAAALQRTFLSFFDTFGYDRIGLSCVLADGICTMGGVAEAKQGYVIVKGGGVPALNVIGYNRQVQWDELLNRLKAVIAGHSRPVIQ